MFMLCAVESEQFRWQDVQVKAEYGAEIPEQRRQAQEGSWARLFGPVDIRYAGCTLSALELSYTLRFFPSHVNATDEILLRSVECAAQRSEYALKLLSSSGDLSGERDFASLVTLDTLKHELPNMFLRLFFQSNFLEILPLPDQNNAIQYEIIAPQIQECRGFHILDDQEYPLFIRGKSMRILLSLPLLENQALGQPALVSARVSGSEQMPVEIYRARIVEEEEVSFDIHAWLPSKNDVRFNPDKNIQVEFFQAQQVHFPNSQQAVFSGQVYAQIPAQKTLSLKAGKITWPFAVAHGEKKMALLNNVHDLGHGGIHIHNCDAELYILGNEVEGDAIHKVHAYPISKKQDDFSIAALELEAGFSLYGDLRKVIIEEHKEADGRIVSYGVFSEMPLEGAIRDQDGHFIPLRLHGEDFIMITRPVSDVDNDNRQREWVLEEIQINGNEAQPALCEYWDQQQPGVWQAMRVDLLCDENGQIERVKTGKKVQYRGLPEAERPLPRLSPPALD